MDAGSQIIPHLEGQFITYTCPPGFNLTGPNASVCTGNGEWEPNPGKVDCIGSIMMPILRDTIIVCTRHNNLRLSYLIKMVSCIYALLIPVLNYHTADCGVPLVDRNVMLNYSSTLEGFILTLTCQNEIDILHISSNATNEQILSVICHSSGNWIPDPTQFNCSSSTTAVPPGNILYYADIIVAC